MVDDSDQGVTRLDGPRGEDLPRPPVADLPPPLDGPPSPGTTIGGRYRLESLIETGGMASVWRAVDEVLNRRVAVKVLLPKLAADPDLVARFRREAVAAARLSHQGIVSIYDTCHEPEAIVMELVDGRTLHDELHQRGFLPPEEAVAVASAVAQALHVAHAAGVVHRDVKPGNVLLSADGHVKVADFGIAKAHRADDPDLPDLTNAGLMVGTAKYLAPEQVSGGAIDARTDVYGLGAVLYEMLCGRPPFTGENALATATARLHAMPERPRSVLRTVPERLDAIVMRALATDPDHRYPTTLDLWSDLQAAPLGAETGGAVNTVAVDPTALVRAPSFTSTERSWMVPAVLVTVIAMALGLAWLLIGGTEARQDLADLVDRVTPGGGGGSSAVLEGDDLTIDAFDPLGGDGENNDLASRAADGDAATQWQTENYSSSDFGGLKAGVGLIVDLGESRSLHTLEIDTTSRGWDAEIVITDDPADDRDGWGEATATVTGADDATTRIDLDGARGSYALIWFTDLGSEPGERVEVQEVRVDVAD